MNILFVCTGNTCRSPMAETMCIELLKTKMRRDVEVASAGTSVYLPSGASYNSIMAMAERNIDLSSHTSRPITSGSLEWADAIYCMTKGQANLVKTMYPDYQHKVFTLSQNDISDPFGGSLEEYKLCANQIFEAVKAIVEGLS